MKKVVIGLGFTLTGVVMDGAILTPAFLDAVVGGFSGGHPLWDAMFFPGITGFARWHLGIPFVFFGLLIAWGLLLISTERCRRSAAPEDTRQIKRALIGLGLSVTGAVMDGFILLWAYFYHEATAMLSYIQPIRFDIPFTVFAAVLLWGLSLLFSELFRRTRPACPPSCPNPTKVKP